MRKVSLKQAKRLREYNKVRLSFMEENPYCQAMVTCHGLLSTDIHHVRGKIGDKLTDVKDFMSVCRGCHTWIHDNDAKAREMGFLKSRLS